MSTYALVIDDQIQSIGRLPNSARRLDDGAWVMGLADATQALREATGWTEVVDTPRPADTGTTTHDRSVDLVAGVPTVVWTERAKTTEEQASDLQVERRSIVDQAISDAIAELRALADAAPLPAVPTIPAGTFTTAQLSDYIRSIRTVIAAQRDANQATRAGAQRVAETLANKIALDRGDFAHLDD